MSTVKLGRSRQIVIPKKLYDALGLAPGDYLEVELYKDNRLLVTPKELVLSMDTTQNVGSEGEVTLKVEGGLRGKADPGIEIEFEGVPSAYSKDPFMLTFDVEKEKLKGWPVQAAPVQKKAAPKKAGVTKKKS